MFARLIGQRLTVVTNPFTSALGWAGKTVQVADSQTTGVGNLLQTAVLVRFDSDGTLATIADNDLIFPPIPPPPNVTITGTQPAK